MRKWQIKPDLTTWKENSHLAWIIEAASWFHWLASHQCCYLLHSFWASLVEHFRSIISQKDIVLDPYTGTTHPVFRGREKMVLYNYRTSSSIQYLTQEGG